MESKYINLKVHSIYSVLQGTLNATAIASRAAILNHPAVCLTDRNLCGALEFSMSCLNYNIKPIIGCKMLLKFEEVTTSPVLVTFIVKTTRGYNNLLGIINECEVIDETYVVNYKTLKSYGGGLVLLIGERSRGICDLFCTLGENVFLYKLNLLYLVMETLCVEIQRKLFTNNEYESTLIEFAILKNLFIVATNETFFDRKEDYKVYEIMRAISKQPIGEITVDNFFKDYHDMIPRYPDVIYALCNTVKLSEECNFWLERQEVIFPRLLKSLKLEQKLLYLRAIQTLEYIFYINGNSVKRLYYDRLLQELTVIALANYAGYFLMVTDFVTWARDNDVYVGPGRGSAAGSLVAFCLNITQVDPLKHGLLFERFLNLNRNNIPDIDTDFCQRDRGIIIRYIQYMYGVESVGQITTFGMFQTKIAMRDIGKCLEVSRETMDEFYEIAASFNYDLVKAKEVLVKQGALTDSTLINKLLEVTMKILGVYKLMSTHAAGIIIDSVWLTVKAPVTWDNSNEINIVRHSMNWIESIGLTKFDLLGLQTLTSLGDVLDEIHSSRAYVALNHMDDIQTFKTVCDGQVLNLFQLEGGGLKWQINRLQPSNLNDLAALIALYRPGPMKHISLYSDAKHGRTPRASLHKAVDYLLNETYGIVIYQEQVMLIARRLAGYTLTEADVLRQVMAKKDKTELAIHKAKFIKGAKGKNIIADIASNLYDTLVRFSDYGFNKSHAIAYGILAYITAYLKANFPVEFYSINMTAELLDQTKVTDLYYEALRVNIKFLTPSVESNCSEFESGNNCIRFPLNYVKGVGDPIANEIIKVKKKKSFNNLFEFCVKMKAKVLSKRMLKNLIYSGALDCFEGNRIRLIESIKIIRECIKTKQPLALKSPRYIRRQETWELLHEEYLLLNCFISRLPFACEGYELNQISAVLVSKKFKHVTLVTNRDRWSCTISNAIHVKLWSPYIWDLANQLMVKED
ncbi:MAG: DNA polymerase III subunit alpha [Candidatus Hodgkinia cicadicola]